MDTDDPSYEEASHALDSIEARSRAGVQRWGWVRWIALALVGLLVLIIALSLRATFAADDARQAAQTVSFSEVQRAARANRGDCIHRYETSYRLADARFNAAIVQYLAFDEGTITEAEGLLSNLRGVAKDLERIEAGELCTKEHFGVED